MTLACEIQESLVMKRNPEPAEKREPRPSEQEFWLDMFRKMSDVVDGWTRCRNTTCRRQRRCRGDARACRDDGSPSRTHTPEERAKAMHELRIGIEKRKAELAAGAQPVDLKTLRKLRKKARIKARRKAARKQAYAGKPAPMPPQAGDTPAPVAEPPLAPEKLERIDRAGNDYLASLPAKQDRSREPGPRITQL
jgi:hypothetical protein